eukprot:CAMPEP_0175307582 /NCGR_PEP_ID=MMETSP0093-20121207/64846_1 /TAXON_ID=311494 /ORGANISM="Alexandrium monilatum, Strain CCMP3105" /LENGTH=61 /DNA_ID=CAMNT_0016604069 /DNA_START=65 /DNA_END=247 /DNA_ORIENTATION=+
MAGCLHGMLRSAWRSNPTGCLGAASGALHGSFQWGDVHSGAAVVRPCAAASRQQNTPPRGG